MGTAFLLAALALMQSQVEVPWHSAVYDFTPLVDMGGPVEPDDLDGWEEPRHGDEEWFPLARVAEVDPGDRCLTLTRCMTHVAALAGDSGEAKWIGGILTLTAPPGVHTAVRSYEGAARCAFGGRVTVELIDLSTVEVPDGFGAVLTPSDIVQLRPLLGEAPFDLAQLPLGHARRLGSRTHEDILRGHEAETAQLMAVHDPLIGTLESGTSLRVLVHRGSAHGSVFLGYDFDARARATPMDVRAIPSPEDSVLELPEVDDAHAVGSAVVEVGGGLLIRARGQRRDLTKLLVITDADIPDPAAGYVHIGPLALAPDVVTPRMPVGVRPRGGLWNDGDPPEVTGGNLTLEEAAPSSSSMTRFDLGLGAFLDPAVAASAAVQQELARTLGACKATGYSFDIAYGWISVDRWRELGGHDLDAARFSSAAEGRTTVATYTGRVGSSGMISRESVISGWNKDLAQGVAAASPIVGVVDHGVRFRVEPLVESRGQLRIHCRIDAAAPVGPGRVVKVAGRVSDDERPDGPYGPFRRGAVLPIDLGTSGYAHQDGIQDLPIGGWAPLSCVVRGDAERVFVATVRIQRQGAPAAAVPNADDELVIPAGAMHATDRLGGDPSKVHWWDEREGRDWTRREHRRAPDADWVQRAVPGVQVNSCEALIRVRGESPETLDSARTLLEEYRDARVRRSTIEVWQIPLEELADLDAAIQEHPATRASVLLGSEAVLSRANRVGHIADYSAEHVNGVAHLDPWVKLVADGLDLRALVGTSTSGDGQLLVKLRGAVHRLDPAFPDVRLQRFGGTPIELPWRRGGAFDVSALVAPGVPIVVNRSARAGTAIVVRVERPLPRSAGTHVVDTGELGTEFMQSFPLWADAVHTSLEIFGTWWAEDDAVVDWDRSAGPRDDVLRELLDLTLGDVWVEEGSWALIGDRPGAAPTTREAFDAASRAIDRRGHTLDVAHRVLPADEAAAARPGPGWRFNVLRAIEGDACRSQDLLERAVLRDIDAQISGGLHPPEPVTSTMRHGTAFWYRPIAHGNGRVQGLFEALHLSGEDGLRTAYVSGMGPVPVVLDPSQPDDITFRDLPDVPIQLGRSEPVHVEARLDLAPGEWQRVAFSHVPGTGQVFVAFARAELSPARD